MEAVSSLLDNIRDVQTRGGVVCADRGYGGAALWTALAARNFGFVLAVGDGFLHRLPLIAASNENASHVEDEFRIPDEEHLGESIFLAETKLRTQANGSVTAVAYAVREWKPTKSKKEAGKGNRVLRFVTSDVGDFQRRLRDTYIWDSKPSKASDQYVLFYPSTSTSTAIPAEIGNRKREIEQYLQQKAVPLTIGQRCADWYNQQRYVQPLATAQTSAPNVSDVALHI